MKIKKSQRLTYQDQKIRCTQFIKNFEDYDSLIVDPIYGRRKYLIQLQEVANGEKTNLQILFEDLQLFFRKQDEKDMVNCFKINVKRYISTFTQIAADLMPKRNKLANIEDEIKLKFDGILENHRKDNLQGHSNENTDNREKLPTSCHQNFDVSIVFGSGSKRVLRTVSHLDADDIGALVAVKAIVVRAGIVKPEIVVATFACDVCGCENYQQVFDSSYQPMSQCESNKCRQNKVSGKLTFLPGHSKFRSYQELKIQQTSDQLKQGSIPRSMNVTLKSTNVKQASPGDIIIIQGVLLPTRRLGFGQQNNLSFDCHIEAFKILREKKKYVQMAITQQQIQKVQRQRSTTLQDRLFAKLARSIAPQIFGLDYVKKALLLLMTGGVTKQTHDNVKIRGEINIALIGDPGIAKSQLLKHISHLAPRAVYTTGKGSSGVGLTAAIVVDPNTKEISLQAGALVLADMGICCIDQFDKMDQYDRTAIHEVMEQQTVSIAKAGITTTLNARTSILAAANPIYGRYNKGETVQKNINLPAALLSRFDLIFILLDIPQKNRDMQLALHIGKVHQQKGASTQNVYDSEFIRTYIALSKNFRPTINPLLHKELITKYIQKRKQQCDLSKEGQNYTTTRSLLALIRLCQAKAKLRFSNEVSAEDIQDSLEILEESQKSVIPERSHFRPKIDFMSAIFEIVKDRCHYNQEKSEHIENIRKRVLARGYSPEELELTLKNYEKLNVIMVDDDRIRLIS